MKTIKIKNTKGKVLFEHSQENNTLKDTIELAIKKKVSLYGANLEGADLRNSNLRNSDLECANLRNSDLINSNLECANLRYSDLINSNLEGSDLRYSDLRYSNLEGADLRYSDLERANLRYSDLRFAKLYRADLSGVNLIGVDLNVVNLEDAIEVPIHCKWSFGITEDKIHIGCEKRTIEEWDIFFASDEVIETKRGTKEFKQIEAVYNACKAYLQTLNN